MFGIFLLYLSLFTCASGFLIKFSARNPFAHNRKAFVKAEGRQILSENELTLGMLPPWLQRFNNTHHTREALDELAYARGKLPASNEAKGQWIASKIQGWSMHCYELDGDNNPFPVDRTERFDEIINKSWIVKPARVVETVFLGFDQRFGRQDQGDKLKLFQTIVRMIADSGYYTSRAFHAATYDEAMQVHDDVHQQAEEGKLEYFPHKLEIE